MKARLDELFGLDLRSLGVFRIAVAAVLLWDLALRAVDLEALYTDGGVLPAAALLERTGASILLTPHFHLSGSVLAVQVLFGLSFLAGTALLLGWHTRIATLASWFLLASLQARNPYAAAMGGDTLLRLWLFWGVFLPLGARFSLDARRMPRLRESSDRMLSVATAALLLQLAFVYWATGLQKTGETWADGTALHYALHTDTWATFFGVWLREQAALMPLLTRSTLVIEILGPFLAFSPVWTGQFRLAAIALFAGFHGTLALSMEIGLFPAMTMAGWAAFLPTLFWDDLLPRLRGAPRAVRDPGRPRLRTPLPFQVAAGGVLVYVALQIALQLHWLGPARPFVIAIRPIGFALRVNQSWAMFAPDPRKHDRWPVFEGTLADGSTVDPYQERAVDWEKPESLRHHFPTFRWRLYWHYMTRQDEDDPFRVRSLDLLAAYLCREWNDAREGPRRLDRLNMVVMQEDTLPDGVSPPFRQSAHEVPCPPE